MEDSTETATQRSEESQSAVDVGAGKGGQGERGGAVRAGRAEMTVRDSETAPKSEAMRVLGLSDMDWKDWRDKRRALGVSGWMDGGKMCV